VRFWLHLDLESIPGVEILDLEPDLCPGILDLCGQILGLEVRQTAATLPLLLGSKWNCQLRDPSVRSHDVLWLFLGLDGTRDPSVGVQFPFSTPPGLAGVIV
jgi:hypothetical protein